MGRTDQQRTDVDDIADDIKAFLDFEAKINRVAGRQLGLTAYHEAGHAIAFRCRKIGFLWAAVRPLSEDSQWLDDEELIGPGDLGRVQGQPGGIDRFQLEHEWLDQLVITYAGPVAEQRYAGTSRPTIRGGDRKFIEKCVNVCRHDPATVKRDGLALARALVNDHWAEIEAVAAALIDRRFLTSRDIGRICANVRRAA
jgi:hypothetical protein